MKPAVVAIDMGYGHLRAARALADALGTEVLHVDGPPIARADDQARWEKARAFYELTSRASQMPYVGGVFRYVLDTLTSIPHLHPQRDLSHPHAGVVALDRMIQRGLGDGLVRFLREPRRPLLTTFYAPAIIADRHGCADVYCVVTDADINRVWAPLAPSRTRITYFVPSQRAQRRLIAYGVPRENIHFTGFPLPEELLGGPSLDVLRKNLGARLVRLDPEGAFLRDTREEVEHFIGPLPERDREPPMVTFAVGGAGAQVDVARRFLPSLRGLLAAGSLRLCLVAGIRDEIAETFKELLHELEMDDLLGGAVEVLVESSFDAYVDRFNATLVRTDVLWTKPSELTFFGALGLPLVMSWPVGVHERYNRRWAIENGAGIKMRDPRFAGEWLLELLSEGTLAAAAWHGFMRMPKFGTRRIIETLRPPVSLATSATVSGARRPSPPRAKSD